MASDRGNDKVAYLYSWYYPAVLRAIKNIIEAGVKEGIMVGMCGEAAADPLLTPAADRVGHGRVLHLCAEHPAYAQGHPPSGRSMRPRSSPTRRSSARLPKRSRPCLKPLQSKAFVNMCCAVHAHSVLIGPRGTANGADHAVYLERGDSMFYTLTANPAVDMTVTCPPVDSQREHSLGHCELYAQR